MCDAVFARVVCVCVRERMCVCGGGGGNYLTGMPVGSCVRAQPEIHQTLSPRTGKSGLKTPIRPKP